MTVDRMRAIDRYVGIPLCLLLGGVIALSPQGRRRKEPRPAPRFPEQHDVRRILVIKFFGLGSILLATPALRLLREEFPDARIDILTFAANRALVERISLFDAVLTIDPGSIRTLTRDVVNRLGQLTRGHYDLVFDFEFFAKLSTFFSGWTRAPRRIGFALPVRWRELLVTDHVPLSKSQHVSRAFADQVFTVMEPRPLPPVMAPVIHTQDEIELTRLVPGSMAREIVINANAGDTFLERRWLPERFIELVNRLGDNTTTLFVFIGLDAHRGHVQSIIDQTRHAVRCVNTAGQLSLPLLAALLQRSRLLISSDSGPVHLAASLGKPVVALYGPETPAFYGPLGGAAAPVYKQISCSPCMNIYDAKAFHCPYNAQCMHEITVEEVEHAIASLCLPA